MAEARWKRDSRTASGRRHEAVQRSRRMRMRSERRRSQACNRSVRRAARSCQGAAVTVWASEAPESDSSDARNEMAEHATEATPLSCRNRSLQTSFGGWRVSAATTQSERCCVQCKSQQQHVQCSTDSAADTSLARRTFIARSSILSRSTSSTRALLNA